MAHGYTPRSFDLPSGTVGFAKVSRRCETRGHGKHHDEVSAVTAPRYALLPGRAVLAIEGEDARSLLQGLISNDVERLAPDHAIYATLLTPQGKFLHDFFIAERGDRVLLDCEADRRDDLERRLTFYRLRAKVAFAAADDLLIAALWGDGAAQEAGLAEAKGSAGRLAGGVAYVDPRLAAAGARAFLPRGSAAEALEAAGFAPATAEDYDRHRLSLALPDGSRDIAVEKGFLLENGIDDLNGVDFDKGCYVGQELTARTKHRATIRKRLFRVDVDGALPDPGTPVTIDGRAAGVMRSGRGDVGLALLRVEQLAKAAEDGIPLTCGDARLTPVKPSWATY